MSFKIGFDNEKYLKTQSEHIRQRISQFGDKLYLEFGGKLFDGNILYDEEDIPVYTSNTTRGTEEERPVGDTRSFLDYLHSQINDFDISPTERDIIEVLIGSLNENGFIDRSIDGISDDLLFKFNTDASRSEIEAAIQTLQKFEPAGIGARNLQECLLIQIKRQMADSEHLTPTRRDILQLEQDIISNHFDSFKQQDTASIASSTGAGEDQVAKAFEAISRLNPRPGLALSESADTGYPRPAGWL